MKSPQLIENTLKQLKGVLSTERYMEGMRNQKSGVAVEVDSQERIKDLEDTLDEMGLSYSTNSVTVAFTIHGEKEGEE